MLDSVKVAMCQIEIAPLEIEKNQFAISEAFRKACDISIDEKPDIVIFPELSNTGYVFQRSGDFGAELHNCAELIPEGSTSRMLSKLCSEYGVYCICGICETRNDTPGFIYNTAAMFDPDGEFLGSHSKMYIPGEEKHYFKAGEDITVLETPLGKIGLEVCYDMWFPELAKVQCLNGAEIIISIWNVSAKMAPKEVFYGFIGGCALTNRCFAVGCNRVGSHDQSYFSGDSMAVDADGKILNDILEEKGVVRATLNKKTMLEARGMQPTLMDTRFDVIKELSDCSEKLFTLNK